jgi:hypothetical protein
MDTRIPASVIFDWWTDLKEEELIKGGKSLKHIKVLKREGNIIHVETEWTMIGRKTIMYETLTRMPPNAWTVKIEKPSPLDIFDEFSLKEGERGNVRLDIKSKVRGRNLMGKLALVFMGRTLRKSMIEEWEFAIKSLEAERPVDAPEEIIRQN